MAKRAKAPFKVGDKVVKRHDRSKVFMVHWVDRKSTTREDQLIKFSDNYCEHGHEADLFELVP